MIPLVKWLNSLDNTTTLYCCQGDSSKIPNSNTLKLPPYIIFLCQSHNMLAYILGVFDHHSWLTGEQIITTVSFMNGCLRYNTKFVKYEAFINLIKRLREAGF